MGNIFKLLHLMNMQTLSILIWNNPDFIRTVPINSANLLQNRASAMCRYFQGLLDFENIVI